MKKDNAANNTRKSIDEDSLSMISGGTNDSSSNCMRISCCSCKRIFPANISKAFIKCPYCGETNYFAG